MTLAIAGVCSHAAFASADVPDAKQQLEPQPVAPSTQSQIVITAPKASESRPDPTADLGHPGDPDTVSRIVHLRPDSTYANVDYGQNVEFIATNRDGKRHSFAWRFNVWPNTDMMYLNQVAPEGFIDHKVRIYIGPDPQYFGS
jgi:hypothetical protein